METRSMHRSCCMILMLLDCFVRRWPLISPAHLLANLARKSPHRAGNNCSPKSPTSSPRALVKHPATSICAFLCASVSLPEALLAGGNLVPNPGFETTGWWHTYGSAGKVNVNAHTGSYSMRVTPRGDGAWQQISVTPNTTYTLTAWGKKDLTLAYLMIYVKNYGGAEIQRYFTSTSYAQNSITFKPTGTSCEIGAWACNGAGYGYADDFVLSAIPTPALRSNVIYLAWQAPPTPPLLSGYFVYRGPAPGSYNFKESVGNVLSWHSQPLLPGTYYFSTTAFDGTHESVHSNEVSAVVQ